MKIVNKVCNMFLSPLCVFLVSHFSSLLLSSIDDTASEQAAVSFPFDFVDSPSSDDDAAAPSSASAAAVEAVAAAFVSLYHTLHCPQQQQHLFSPSP